MPQGSRIRSVRILFSERYVRTLTYSILAYVNKNRICTQTMIAEAANWFFATVLINLLFDYVQGESKKVDPLRLSTIFSLRLNLFA